MALGPSFQILIMVPPFFLQMIVIPIFQVAMLSSWAFVATASRKDSGVDVATKAAVGAASALMEDKEAVKENVRIWRQQMRSPS